MMFYEDALANYNRLVSQKADEFSISTHLTHNGCIDLPTNHHRHIKHISQSDNLP